MCIHYRGSSKYSPRDNSTSLFFYKGASMLLQQRLRLFTQLCRCTRVNSWFLKRATYFYNSVNRCVIVCVNCSFQFIVPKRVARVAKQFTARTIGGVTFFVEDDIENDVFVCGSRWFVYVPGLVVHTHSEGWQPTDDGVVGVVKP